MNVKIECADCETSLTTYAKLEGDEVLVMVDPCPNCIARAILQSEDEPWLRNKFLKAGKAA